MHVNDSLLHKDACMRLNYIGVGFMGQLYYFSETFRLVVVVKMWDLLEDVLVQCFCQLVGILVV